MIRRREPMHSMSGGLVVTGLIGAVLIAIGAVGCAREGNAHEAKAGWRYPLECCSNKDCREVAAQAVRERGDGFVIEATGERIGHADPRLRKSPDGLYHWCSTGGEPDGRTLCLFVPPRSF